MNKLNQYSLIVAVALIIQIFNFANIISSDKKKHDIIIDSNMTLEEALHNTLAPKDVLDSMKIIEVEYYSFDKKLHQGQLVVNKAVAEDIREIFVLIKEKKFPIEKVIPIVKYDWSDDSSMQDNNTSSFNFRFVAGTKRMSNHALGRAIDINPVQNPAVYADKSHAPKNGYYNKKNIGTLTSNNFIVKEFLRRGWRWGGNFQSFKDWQHFDKTN